MSEAEVYALAWSGVVMLWAVCIGLFMADAGVDAARIPVIGPLLDRVWNALLGAVHAVLGGKR